MGLNGPNLDACTITNQSTGKQLRDTVICKGWFARFFHKKTILYTYPKLGFLIYRLLRYSQRTKEQKLFRCASPKYQMGLFSITRLTVYKTKKTTKTTKKLQKPEKTTFSREK